MHQFNAHLSQMKDKNYGTTLEKEHIKNRDNKLWGKNKMVQTHL